MTSNHLRNNKRAFTVIELLVVISIIALLIAILLPSMGKAREASRRVVCAANLHQTGTAHLAWAADHSRRLVEGQPAFDVSSHTGHRGGQGQYAVWWRGWNSPRKEEYGGAFTKHGALYAKGYHASPETFYCPSWRNAYTQFETSGADIDPNVRGGGFFRDMSKMHPKQRWMQTSYHYNSQFGSEDYRSVSDWRGARLSIDKGAAALMADAFSDPSSHPSIGDEIANRGVDMHHVVGYSVLYLDGAVRFVDDPNFYVRDLNGGSTYHYGQSKYRNFQSVVWRFFEGRS